MDKNLNEQLNRMRKLMGLNESFLLEKMSNDEIYNKYYNKIPKEDFEAIVNADPTKKKDGSIGKFTKWMLGLYQKGNLKIEDLYKATQYLGLYTKNFNHVTKKDINMFKTLPELFDEINKFIDNADDYKSNSERDNEIKKDAEKVFEDDVWTVIVPKTKEASCYYGKGTQWCTAASENNYEKNMFDRYNRRDKLYININKKEQRKYQFHFNSSMFMDEQDNSIESPVYKVIGMTEKLILFYISLKVNTKDLDFMYDENTDTIMYANADGYFEKLVEKDGNNTTYEYTSKGLGKKYTQQYTNGVKNGKKIEYRYNIITRIYNYKNGIVDGEYKEFYESGNVKVKHNYVNGHVEGESLEFYDNGKVRNKSTYVKDKIEGDSFEYYNNGNIKKKYTYKNHVLNGTSQSYSSDGNLELSIDYKNGHKNGLYIEYSNNLKNQLTYENDILNGDAEKWDGDTLIAKAKYVNGSKEGDFYLNDISKGLITKGVFERNGVKSFTITNNSGKVILRYEDNVLVSHAYSANVKQMNNGGNYYEVESINSEDSSFNELIRDENIKQVIMASVVDTLKGIGSGI